MYVIYIAKSRRCCEITVFNLSGLSRFKVCATRVNILNSPNSPYFIIVERKTKRA